MLKISRTAYRLAAGIATGLFLGLMAAGCRTTATKKAAMVPRSCPQGAELKGSPPPGGTEIWCEKDVDGVPVKDGVFVVYNVGGDRMLEGYYDNGKQSGEWTMWYNNGQRASIDHYKNGVQNGLHVSWYANGSKAIEGNYSNGEREGIWHRWDPNGLRTWTDVYKNDIEVSSTPGNSAGSGEASGSGNPASGASATGKSTGGAATGK
jgi:MORN repeat variant